MSTPKEYLVRLRGGVIGTYPNQHEAMQSIKGVSWWSGQSNDDGNHFWYANSDKGVYCVQEIDAHSSSGDSITLTPSK